MSRPRPGTSVVRDPVHGDLHLTAEEMDLLDTTEMQRLRGVRQLGTAYLVYPGAQHTRFEHSLGTLHLLSRLVDAVELHRQLAPAELDGVDAETERILRAAALVHDVTHVPFGHNIEDQCGLLERHDTPARFRRALAGDGELAEVLRRMGIQEEVLAILCPDGEPGLPSIPPFWRELLSDTLCADIFDYLARDAYFTGLQLLYDPRVLEYFKVDRASGHLFVDVVKRGLVREDVLSEIVRVLEARYFFSERVYYHHAKIAAGAMISRCVEGSLLDGGLVPEALYDQTDDSLLTLLEQHRPDDAVRADQHVDLLRRFRSRRLLKRACVYPLYANQQSQQALLERFFAPGRPAERQDFETQLAARVRAAGHEPGPVVLYCPARRMQLKEVATHVRFPGAEGLRPLSDFQQQIPRLADLERQYRGLWKLYVLVGSRDPATLRAVAQHAAALLPEATNVYEPADPRP